MLIMEVVLLTTMLSPSEIYDVVGFRNIPGTSGMGFLFNSNNDLKH